MRHNEALEKLVYIELMGKKVDKNMLLNREVKDGNGEN